MRKMTSKRGQGTTKVSFYIVELGVQNMFAKALEEDIPLPVFLERAEEFIISCGWGIDEYDEHKKYWELN